MSKREDDKTECPNCGYIYDSPFLPSYLPPGTVLSDRYVLGKLKSYNGESAKYIAFDTITEATVLISEYMPDAICSRVKSSPVIIVNKDYIAQYKTLLSEFVSLNKSLSKMRNLNHVAAVTDMFGDNNTGYAVFEYQKSKTLNEYLKENAGEITWEEAKKLIPPLLTTVSLIHNAGIIHRGISPSTVLINDKNELILTGFAISEVRTANTVLASEIYAGYAAPEQYNSSNWHDTWTDVYGVSALIYRCLTGITPVDSLVRTTTDSLVPPNMINPSVPKSVSKAIMKGLTLSHEMRVQNITELVTLLFDQPDYKSERLSSSSTTSISLEALKNAKEISKPAPVTRKTAESSQTEAVRRKTARKKRLSRRRVFVATGGLTLLIGVCVLFVIFLIDLPDSSGSVLQNSDITSSESSVSSFEQIITTTAPTETAVTSQATEPAAIYIMDDIVGSNFDLIANSTKYNTTLIFNPEYEFNDDMPKGNIISQSIPKGGTYQNGDEITVKVSNGPKYVTIPDYGGLTATAYFTLLNESGIKYEQVEEMSTVILEGYVVKTSKNAGEQLDNEIGEILIVYVAKNPPKPETTPSPDAPVPIIPTLPDDSNIMIDLPFEPMPETTPPPSNDVVITFYN
jgi:serine/threonine-protein kinase